MLSGSKGLIRSMASGTDFANSFGKALWRHLSSRRKAGRKVPGPYLRCPPRNPRPIITPFICVSTSLVFPFFFFFFLDCKLNLGVWVNILSALSGAARADSGVSVAKTAMDQQNVEVLSVRLRRNFGSSARRSRFSSPVRASARVDPETFSH